MKKIKHLVALLVCSASLVTQASTVSYSTSFSSLTDLTNQPILISQFDPGLGVLQSATFTLDATMNTQAFAANDGNFFAGWDKLQYSFSFAGAAPYSSVGISANALPVRVVGNGSPSGSFTFSQMQNIIGPNPNVWTFNGPTLTASNTFIQAAQNDFIGNGNLSFFLTTQNLDALSIAGAQTGGIPLSSQGLSTNVMADVLVTYTYAVPEPESYAMLLAGLGMLAAIARRKTLAQ